MLFNSYVFIFAFLPMVLLGYYLLPKSWSKPWMILASLFFYGFYWPSNLLILLLSILVNYSISRTANRSLFWIGIAFNVGLLCFYKYAPGDYLLPLGLSFWTLQQIAFLIDSYQGMNEKRGFFDYLIFVVFFPPLISGPITKFSDMMKQWDAEDRSFFNPHNFSMGLLVFCIGLAKKVLLADTFSSWVTPGFDELPSLYFLEAWKTSLCYTLQLYFDFSGYSEMAIGVGCMFNMIIPPNFNSPLRSLSIIDFWARWHMTLSQFINMYIFTPIVKAFPKITFRNTMLATFLAMTIAGVWHGSGLTFLIYGMLHGLALVINHLWKKHRKKKKKLPSVVSWLLTFNFVNLSFVLFRAHNLSDALKVYKGMLGLNGIVVPKIGFRTLGSFESSYIKLGTLLKPDDYLLLVMLLGSFLLIKYARNVENLKKDFSLSRRWAVYAGLIFTLSIFGLDRVKEFIYFNF